MVPPAVETRRSLPRRHAPPLISATNPKLVPAVARDQSYQTPSFERFQKQQRLAWPPRSRVGGMSPSTNSSGVAWFVGGSLASSAAKEAAGVVARLRVDMRALDEVRGTRLLEIFGSPTAALISHLCTPFKCVFFCLPVVQIGSYLG